MLNNWKGYRWGNGSLLSCCVWRLRGRLPVGVGPISSPRPRLTVRRVLNGWYRVGWGWASAAGSPLGCRSPFLLGAGQVYRACQSTKRKLMRFGRMGYMVARGVDTLIINAYYTDDNGIPRKQELDEDLRGQLRHWKETAIAQGEEMATSWAFHEQCLLMQPNGAGQGQWPYLLRCPSFSLCISHGKWNGIAQVRLSSDYLWMHAKGIENALVEIHSFLYGIFQQMLHLQPSEIHLCVDVAGWDTLGDLSVQRDFVSRAVKRGPHLEADWTVDQAAEYSYGLVSSGFDFSSRSPMSCTIYDKTREIKKSGKLWMEDVWRANGWDEDEDKVVWRVEYKFKREVLNELKQGDKFHGIDDVYELPALLAVLWAYAAGQVQGGCDGLPDGWLRCVVPSEGDKNRSRWPTHPQWAVVQAAFTAPFVVPEQMGKIVRKRKEKRNTDKAIEAMFGYATSVSAWNDGLVESGADTSVFLHWLASRFEEYQERTGKYYMEEVQRKRVKIGRSAVLVIAS